MTSTGRAPGCGAWLGRAPLVALAFLLGCEGAPPSLAPPGAAGQALSAWAMPGQMLFTRRGHTATLLPSGKVLVVGGRSDAAAELYDPATGLFAPTRRPMTRPRIHHSATLLPSGVVLIAGGDLSSEGPGISGGDPTPGTAEIYDPEGDGFTLEGIMNTRRRHHTATLLPNGTVLIAGGDDSSGDSSENEHKSMSAPSTQTAEIYEPVAVQGLSIPGRFVALTEQMTTPRGHHTATLLPSGEVLLAGGALGQNVSVEVARSAELFDFRSGTFTRTTGDMQVARASHTAVLLPPLGSGARQVLLVGSTLPAGKLQKPAEVYRVEDQSFTALTAADDKLLDGLEIQPSATATLLPSGQVLIAGMSSGSADNSLLFTPAPLGFRPAPERRCQQQRGSTATLLPSGKVLLLGGEEERNIASSCAELYGEDMSLPFAIVDKMNESRSSHTATLLHSGSVLILGGAQAPVTPSSTLPALPAEEMFNPSSDPAGGSFDPIAPMHHPRSKHTATLLPTGEVLIAGGEEKAAKGDQGMETFHTETVEIFNPLTLKFDDLSTEGDALKLQERRGEHSATLFPGSGQVLIAGGFDGTKVLSSAEIWTQDTRTSKATAGQMTTPRQNHTATLLFSGKVLIAGGKAEGIGPLLSAELYDPLADRFTPTGAMRRPHARGDGDRFTATLLPSGKVLIVGRGAAELFDPEGDDRRGVFIPCGAPSKDVTDHTATLLPSGQVVIAGGSSASGLVDSELEIFDPATSEFTRAKSPSLHARDGHTATLLPSGQVLFAGGIATNEAGNANGNESANDQKGEIWVPGAATPSALKAPTLSTITPAGKGAATITGTGFLGAAEASTGAPSASDQLPIAIWMPLTGGAVTGELTAWTDSSARWALPRTSLFGDGLFFVVTRGIASHGKAFALDPTRACASHLDCPGDQVCRADHFCGVPLPAATAPAGCGVAGGGGGEERAWAFGIAAALLAIAAGARRRGRAAARRTATIGSPALSRSAWHAD